MSGVHFDNLKVGGFISILSSSTSKSVVMSMVGAYSSQEEKEVPLYPVNGKPLKVMALSYPFISAWDGVRTFAIDSRKVVLTKISKEYAQSLMVLIQGAMYESSFNYSIDSSIVLGGRCPGCFESLTKLDDNLVVCQKCNFQGKFDAPQRSKKTR